MSWSGARLHVPELPVSQRFALDETPERWTAFAARGAVTAAPGSRWYEARDADGALRAALRPPLVLLDGDGLPAPDELARRAEAGPGRYAVLLLRSGAAALGLFDDGELVEHKTFKRYTVRGSGRAQTTHLATKGKSRYGSRLRLRNEERLLEEVNERLGRWWKDEPPAERLYVSCPVRLAARLARADPPPPVALDGSERVRIPLHVHAPSFEELVRVHASIARGRAWSDA